MKFGMDIMLLEPTPRLKFLICFNMCGGQDAPRAVAPSGASICKTCVDAQGFEA